MNLDNRRTGPFLKNAPLFVFVDLLMEYPANGRIFTRYRLDKCMQNCKRILEFARKHRLPIAHFRQVQKSPSGKRSSDLVHWLEDFRPMHNEMVFERNLPSCYSSKEFNKFLSNLNNPHIILLGLTGTQACLSTAIDAYHKNHDLTYIFDGSATPALGNFPEHKAHNFVSEVINLYSRVLSTGEFLEQHQAKIVNRH